MIRGLEAALGTTARLEWLPEQPGDVPQTWASLVRARDLLGYQPTTTFPEGLRRFVEWFRSDEATSRG
jgi:UDP-glucuronate 4-epimerase